MLSKCCWSSMVLSLRTGYRLLPSHIVIKSFMILPSTTVLWISSLLSPTTTINQPSKDPILHSTMPLCSYLCCFDINMLICQVLTAACLLKLFIGLMATTTMHTQYPYNGHSYTNTTLEDNTLLCLYVVYCCCTLCTTWIMVCLFYSVLCTTCLLPVATTTA